MISLSVKYATSYNRQCKYVKEAAKAAAAARGKQSYSGYSSEEEEEELSVEEQQAMEMENERLVEQLNSLTSQVRLVDMKFYINLLVG